MYEKTLLARSVDGPRRVIQLMNRPSRERLASILLMKMDIPDIEMHMLINDSLAGAKGLADLKRAGEIHGMNPVLWSERGELIDAVS